jgi:gamma-glutamyl phosphate reductase
MTAIEKQGAQAKNASRILMTCGTADKNRALASIADALIQEENETFWRPMKKTWPRQGKCGMSISLMDVCS